MNHIPLGDEETRVIFVGEAERNLAQLDASQQQHILQRLLDICQRSTAPSAFVHEQIGNIDIITAGSQCRLYTKVVDNVPRDNTTYHVIYLFYIDAAHDYSQDTLATYSPAAERRMQHTTSLDTVADLEAHFKALDALDQDDLRDLLE